MPQIVYGSECFEYKAIKKKKKNIGILVTPEGEVIVTSPLHVEDSLVHEVVMKKAGWILGKLKLVREISKEIREKEFVSGESIEYLGRRYRLKVIEGGIKGVNVRLFRGKFEVTVDSKLEKDKRQELIKAELIKWLKEQAKVKLKERTEVYSKKLNLVPNRVVVKEQKSIWGSCSSRGNINFNWRLIMAPLSVIDYVVIHELCHL
ncbi:M48 family metallopeptidase, partial [Fonticella tunisiensis]